MITYRSLNGDFEIQDIVKPLTDAGNVVVGPILAPFNALTDFVRNHPGDVINYYNHLAHPGNLVDPSEKDNIWKYWQTYAIGLPLVVLVLWYVFFRKK